MVDDLESKVTLKFEASNRNAFFLYSNVLPSCQC